MNFMHFGKKFILNYGSNEHDFDHYLYQCIREDQLSYLPEIPAESLKRDWKQEPSSAAHYVPWRKLFLSTAQGLKIHFVNVSSLPYLLQFQSAGTGPAQWAPPGYLRASLPS